MSTTPFVLRWGIIGCGRISGTFVRDLVHPPAERGSPDVTHAVTAVGSRDIKKAEAFMIENCPEGASAQKLGLASSLPLPLGSYAEVYAREDVDVIYVGTPHPSHYEDAKNALEAGKHVLLEKPATLNLAEWEDLSKLAKTKQRFLMEAVWTRFFPLTFALQDVLFKEEAIGEVRRVESDFSIDFIDLVDENHRMLNASLAGGGLLDLGPYPLVWAMLLLYHHPQNGRSPPTNVRGAMTHHPNTGVDIFTDWSFDFPGIGMTGAHAALSVSIAINGAKECVTRVQGNKGEIVLPWVTARPDKFIIRRSQVGRGPQAYTEEVREFPIYGTGLNWEADAVARDIRDGKIEDERMPHSETSVTMAIFDEVRHQGEYIYPEGLEKVKLA